MRKIKYGLVIIEKDDSMWDLPEHLAENNEAIKNKFDHIEEEIDHLKEEIRCLKYRSSV